MKTSEIGNFFFGVIKIYKTHKSIIALTLSKLEFQGEYPRGKKLLRVQVSLRWVQSKVELFLRLHSLLWIFLLNGHGICDQTAKTLDRHA